MIKPARYSIQSRLTLVLVLFAAVALAGVGVFAYAGGRGALEAATTAELLASATEKQQALDDWIRERQADAAALTASPAVLTDVAAFMAAPDSSSAGAAHDRMVQELRTQLGDPPLYLDLFILAPDTGQIIASTNPGDEGKYKEDRPYFVNGRNGPYLQNPYFSLDERAPSMLVSAPLRAADGRLLGVIALRPKLDAMSKIIQRRTGQHQSDDAFLVNASNLFVTQPRLIVDPAVLQLGIRTEPVQRCLAHESNVIAANDYRGVPVFAAYRWLPDRELCLIVKLDQAEAFASVRAFGETTAVIGALTLLAASLLAIGLARTFTRPVLALQDGVTRFGQGDLAVRLPEDRRDELGVLAVEFNRMAEALADKDAQLRDYAAGLERRVEERTAELSESEERFRSLYENSTVGIYRTTPDGRILLANPALIAMLGYSSFDELAARNLEQSGFDPAYDRVQFVETIERDGQIKGLEASWTRRDETAIYVRESARAIRDAQDKTLYYDGIIEDITEQKRAELVLQASEARYRSLFENMLNGLAYCQMLFDGERPIDFVYLEINQAFEPLTGLKDVVGKKVSEVIPNIQESDPELIELYGRVASTGIPELLEVYVAALDMWFSISVYSPERGYFIAVFDVITERKRAEVRIRKLNRVYAVLSDVNQAIVRVRDSQALFEATCHIAVEKGGFRLAWIGQLGEADQQVQIAAHAGMNDSYIDQLDIVTSEDQPRGQGPTAVALRTGQYAVVSDIEHDLRMEPWREAALRCGYRSSAAFPLKVKGETRGTINLYAGEAGFFDEEEIKLLDELALDISFSMEFTEKELERQQAEEALLASEARYRHTLDAMLEGCQIIGFDWRYLYLNDIADKHNRRPKTELLGQKYMDMWPGIEATEVFRVIRRCLEDRVPHSMENEFVFPAGGEGWFELRVYPVPEGSVILSIDITERKQAEMALRDSEERFRKAVLEAPIPMLIHDEDDRNYTLSKGWTKFSGYTLDDIPTMGDWTEHAYGARSTFAKDYIDNLFQISETVSNGEWVINTNGNQQRTWDFYTTPLGTSTDGKRLLLSLAIDVTERKQAEEEIRQLNADLEQRVAQRTAELSDLYNNAPCGYHSLDSQGVFVLINDTELSWLGYTREEIVGRMKATDLFTPASVEVFNQDFPVFKARGWLQDLELEMVRKDGSILPVLLNATVITDQNGRYLMSRSTVIDHTDRKRAETQQAAAFEAMREAQTQLEAANKELEAFAYSVSHDLRAPLRAIDGFSRILLEDYADKFDAEGQRLFSIVRSNAQKMDQLITDLLALSRVTRSQLLAARFDMTALVDAVYNDSVAPAVQAQFTFTAAALPEADGDATLLRQVWSNLISNAIKYTLPKAERRIEVGGYRQGGEHIYFIKDTGVGFNPAYAHKLFGVFQRLHKAEEFEGTGVGLAIVQRIVQRHGGRVWAESQVDQGATFYFSLPYTEADHEPSR